MARERHAPEFLREALHYDSTAGTLTWRARPRHHFLRDQDHSLWNNRFAGIEAFCGIDGDGYRFGLINRKRYSAHRVIWAIVQGVWPTSEIDHKNGNRDDNRLENLRECSSRQNKANTRLYRSRTGLKGAFHKTAGSFQAAIRIDGKKTYLGSFPTAEEAHAAYACAARQYFGEFARTA